MSTLEPLYADDLEARECQPPVAARAGLAYWPAGEACGGRWRRAWLPPLPAPAAGPFPATFEQ